MADNETSERQKEKLLTENF